MEANRVGCAPVVRVASAVLLLSLGAALDGGRGGPVAAQPAGPAVTVSSPAHVGDGVFADMVLSGFPAGFTVLVQCAGEVVTAPPSEGPALCHVVQTLSPEGTPPTTAVWRVVGRFATYDQSRIVDCATEPSGCVAGAATLTDPGDPTSVIAVAFDDLEFSDALTGAPTGGLADGDTVVVQGVGMTSGDWAIAQCDRAFLTDPTPEQAAGRCAAPTTVAVADGTFEAALVVHDPLVTAAGGSLPCDGSGCVVVLSSPSSPGDLAATHLGIAFGPMTLDFTPRRALADGQPVALATRSSVGRQVHVRLCALPLGPTLTESRCGYLDGRITVTDTGDGTGTTLARSRVTTPDGEMDCRVETCAFAAFAESDVPDEPTVAVSPPLELLPFPTVTPEPAEGLLDGDPMAITGSYLLPATTYGLELCVDSYCGLVDEVPVGADGTLRTTVTASPIIGVPPGRYCRTDCTILLVPRTSIGEIADGTYAMAAGTLTAAPDSDLIDGQTIDITGDDLMPTYAGPPLFGFATGGWALTQCDAAVLDDPTLFGVFTHCSVPPPTRAVTIEGSTLDTDLEVQATIQRILGGTTDCTAAPGACVVGLVRFELDASLSTHLTPIAFT